MLKTPFIPAVLLLSLAFLGACSRTQVADSAATEAEAKTKTVLPSARSGDTDFNPAVAEGVVGDVVKGDEIVLSDGTQVRMIGVFSPIAHVSQRQGEYYGKGAYDLTSELVLGKRVRLEYDKQSHDSRGRILAYVHTEDGRLVQEELLRSGNAFAASFPPNVKYYHKFIAWQREAMAERAGMWNYDLADYDTRRDRDQYIIEGVRVKRVIKGDTIELDDGTVVRYIGIDAVDSANRHIEGEVGHAAYTANRRLVEGRELTIEYDVDINDPHGRELAWVFVDGELVNTHLVREGHANVAIFPPNVKYIEQLLVAQDEAAEAGRGMWGGQQQ